LYQNLNGKKFKRVDGIPKEVSGKQGISVAFVDMDNDGWLDIVLTAFDAENFL
jgi:hypothetical protein